MCLRGIDIQIWEGNLLGIHADSFRKQEDLGINNTTRLDQLICPRSHSWKFEDFDQNLNQDLKQKLTKKAFSINDGQDRYVWNTITMVTTQSKRLIKSL